MCPLVPSGGDPFPAVLEAPRHPSCPHPLPTSVFQPMHLASAQGVSQQKAASWAGGGPDPQHLQPRGTGRSAEHPLAWSEQPPKGTPVLSAPLGSCTLTDVGLWNHIKGEAVQRLRVALFSRFSGWGAPPGVMEGVGLSVGRSGILSQLCYPSPAVSPGESQSLP